MVFSNITFLFIFLPVLLVIYYITPSKYKKLILIISSLLFYAWGEIRYIVLIIAVSILDFTCGKKLSQNKNNPYKRKLFAFLSIGTNLFILIFFKYINFFINNFNSWFGYNLTTITLPLPLGISFITFQSISYIIDVYKGVVAYEKNYYNYLTYITFFPKLIQGPITRYITIKDNIKYPSLNYDNFSDGVKRFILGLGKKVLIADNLGQLWSLIQTGSINEMSLVLYWVGAISFMLQIYFDFSGYSDMAIGLGKMFGVTLAENFNYPYTAKSITDFWRKWHMSLSSWFRDYIYIPLGGNRNGKVTQIRNLIIVWTLTGLWHGASWNFVLWGLYFALILIIEKFILLEFLNKTFNFFQHAYALILILISWVIFSFEDLSKLSHYLKGMFSFTNEIFINKLTIYYLLSYIVTLLLATLASAPILKNTLCRLEKSENNLVLISISLFYVLIFIASVAYLINSTYNSFLYFKF